MPPDPALDHLAGALRPVRDRPGAPRWVGRDAQHVTLAFFGDVPDAQVPRLTGALGGVVAGGAVHLAVHLRLAGAGTFPERGDPRVLWVGVDGEVEALAGLAAAVADAARDAGIPVDRRVYRPHLTVGRWAAAAAGDRRIAAALGNYAGPHFTAGEVVLLRSVHAPAPRYETVASWGAGPDARRGAPGETVGTHRPAPR